MRMVQSIHLNSAKMRAGPNGDPHIAEDYVWSWWRALQPGLGNLYAYMLFPIKNAQQYYEGNLNDFDQVGVKALDQHTLQVTLGNPTPYFLQLLDHYSTFPRSPGDN